MLQSAKFLFNKHEDLSSDSHMPHTKAWYGGTHLQCQCLGGRDRQIPGAPWSESLLKSKSSRLVRDPQMDGI